jgi:hypothetical protein
MKTLKKIQFLLTFAAFALWVAGCATKNVNPAQAKANTGYVDLFTDAADPLDWQVECFDDVTQSFRTVYSEFKPPAGGVVRLGLAPGHYRLRVMFLNLALVAPALAEVEVKDGMITPVLIELSAAGETTVQTKDTSIGSTAYGRYGRRTKIVSEKNATYRAKASAQPVEAYRLKQQMPYAQ